MGQTKEQTTWKHSDWHFAGSVHSPTVKICETSAWKQGLTSWSLDTCKRHKRRRFNPWVGKIPWRREWQPTPVFLSGEFHGQRSLVSYSPWGRKIIRHDLATTQHQHSKTMPRDFPGGPVAKNLPAKAEDTGSLPCLRRSRVL